jgi:hypothetical protein
MASWALACKNCRAVFTHSQIPDTLADYYIPTRPDSPPTGLERECPNCKTRSTYQQADLAFRPGTCPTSAASALFSPPEEVLLRDRRRVAALPDIRCHPKLLNRGTEPHNIRTP